jgi:uncharacterized protein
VATRRPALALFWLNVQKSAKFHVHSAVQPDRKRLADFRAWAGAQVARRAPPLLLALTHVDELRPAVEWTPPYDLTAATSPKARMINAAVKAAARGLDLRADEIVPVAMPPGRETYNIDALWARIAVELDEAKLVQLDRLRLGGKGTSLRELPRAFGHAGQTIVRGIVGA